MLFRLITVPTHLLLFLFVSNGARSQCSQRSQPFGKHNHKSVECSHCYFLLTNAILVPLAQKIAAVQAESRADTPRRRAPASIAGGTPMTLLQSAHYPGSPLLAYAG